jgi:hypothetical protein
MTDTLVATTLDDFMLWRVDQLKTFLLKRGLKVSGRRKDKLVALPSLPFGAVEMCIPGQASITLCLSPKMANYQILSKADLLWIPVYVLTFLLPARNVLIRLVYLLLIKIGVLDLVIISLNSSYSFCKFVQLCLSRSAFPL